MANTLITNISHIIQGDGASLTATIPLGYVPTSVSLVAAASNLGVDVSSNIASVVISGTNLLVTFNAAFSYILTLIVNLTPVIGATVLTQPVSGTITASVSNFPVSQVVTLASTTITGSVAVTGTFFQATQPVSGTITANAGTGNFGVNLTQLNSVALGSPSNYGTSPGAVSVQGVNAFITAGVITTVSSVTSCTLVGASRTVGNAGATLDAAINGAASTNALWTEHAPSTAAAAAMATPTTIVALTVANVKASAGNVYGLSVSNTSSTPIFLQFYNTAGTPVLGTSVIFSIPCFIGITNVPIGPFAYANFSTGIGIGASTSPLSTGAPSVSPTVTVFFK